MLSLRAPGAAVVGGLWALMVVSASAAPPAVSGPSAPPLAPGVGPDAPFTVSGELRDLPLRAAVPKLAELTGLEVVLPEPEEGIPPPASPEAPDRGAAMPRLDLDRRATLTWQKTPLAQALREFCYAYGCRFDSSGDAGGSLYLNAGVLPRGPMVTVGDYSVEVALLHFRDERSADLAGEESTVERGLDLQLQVRSRSGDPTPIYGFHNVRVVDDQGRDALEHPGDRDIFGLGGAAAPTAFPDERRRFISFPWPYPAPRRFRTIEGDLLLFSHLRRVPVDLHLPRPGDTAQTRRVGPAQLEAKDASYEEGRFTLGLQVAAPAGLGVQVAGPMSRVRLVLEDGSTVTAPLIGGEADDVEDGARAHLSAYELSAAGLKTRPVRLLVDLVFKSDPDRRLHFRFTDFPAALGARVRERVRDQTPRANVVPQPPGPPARVILTGDRVPTEWGVGRRRGGFPGDPVPGVLRCVSGGLAAPAAWVNAADPVGSGWRAAVLRGEAR